MDGKFSIRYFSYFLCEHFCISLSKTQDMVQISVSQPVGRDPLVGHGALFGGPQSFSHLCERS